MCNARNKVTCIKQRSSRYLVQTPSSTHIFPNVADLRSHAADVRCRPGRPLIPPLPSPLAATELRGLDVSKQLAFVICEFTERWIKC